DEVTDEEAAANSPSSGKAKARDTVNIRESASTTADRVAVAYKGEEMTVINKQADGWTKVKFNGKTGYVKSEYLE
ncbi:MAG: SH3 domain-containing protein, partial [Lachnospiraceae bacterium]|nr:SH3 domain-containing protein [Lachnospiraceae bacterium]